MYFFQPIQVINERIVAKTNKSSEQCHNVQQKISERVENDIQRIAIYPTVGVVW